ncbi:uncharacterized protein EI97DRAFT_459096 [Westerdykella ornata]|uniref:CFEM domain-containing protein n=1 Tax=Westerdykella ornata TaxID=318751 RepID=A0A6A6JI46_WESOR|nr:uncharacterized protein EI97DRAFT_459096 [Westerdykella ornata]KAF2275628.1 hypothetical protein EI97DRAFT_459096 [Westerdykella ornata]
MHLAFLAVIAAGVNAIAIPNPQGAQVASIGQCPKDCWNESAGLVDCDPEADDECLCGIFFDLVTNCVSQTCSLTDNLGMSIADPMVLPCQ